MTQAKAEQVILISAAAVGGIYAYQKYYGSGTSEDLTSELTAWAAVFLILALLAMASPGLAAAFAGLVVLVDLYANGPSLLKSAKTSESKGTAQLPAQTSSGSSAHETANKAAKTA